MTKKTYAILGFLAPVLFWGTYFIMAGQRPEYDFLTKAVSELGSVDAPNKWIWNGVGYILTGVLIAIFSIGLHNDIKTENSSKLPGLGIFLSGIFMVLSGLFPGDFEEKQATTMLLHTIGSFGSYLFFLMGAFTFPTPMKKSPYWKNAVRPTLTITWLSIIFGSWPFVFRDFPAVGQRIVFAFYFLWMLYTAYRLYHSPLLKNDGD
ncbi:DUF998 domain-containing protein [Flagellimonas sp. DF-77]|uniref:DUF998 domain-containing protein n=1 Tax=Flagellimonas algarum TaxID=3230298 RepID=UPI003397EE19